MYKVILFAFLGICSSIFGQNPQIIWDNTIGGTGADTARSMDQTSDGGIVILGESLSPISGDKTEGNIGDFDYWVVKLDVNGAIQWQNTIGGSISDRARSIKQTPDGGYIIGGYSASFISGDKTEDPIGANDYWILKLDSTGTVQWDNTIGGTGSDTLFSIELTSDGGYLLGGSSESGISGDKTEPNRGGDDYWIVKIDGNGSIIWDKTIGGSSNDDLIALKETIDGGYLLAGHSNSNISGEKTENSINGSRDYWLVKLDSNLAIQWDETIGGNGGEEMTSMVQTSDGGYLIGGNSNSNSSADKTEDVIGVVDYWIVKTDGVGNVEWDNTIGGNLIEFGGNALETTDGNYVVLGHSQSGISGDKTENSLGSYDYWFLILNSNGSILYQDTIGGDQVDSNFFMDYSQQGESFYIVGSSFSNISGDKTEDNIGGTDFWIVKLDNVLNIAIQEFRNDLTLFPNPGKDFLVWNYPEMNIEQLKVFDIHGKQLNLISEISENRLDISRLASGVYVIQLTSEGTTITKKFIKE